jgi:hypothetical protein
MPYNFLGTADLLKTDANGAVNLNGLGADISLTSLNLGLGRSVANFGAIVSNGTKNTYIGVDTGIVAVNSSLNTFIGANCGKALINGQQNTFVGADAGSKVTGSFNTFIGSGSGTENVTGEYNTFVGYEAGKACTGGDNSFFGVRAGTATTTAFGNVFFGELSGVTNTTGSNNTYVGLYAGRYTTTASGNTVIGANNQDVAHTTGSGNTLIGTGLTGYGNITNTVLIADGANNKHLTMDSVSSRFLRPIRPPQSLVAALPTAASVGAGSIAYVTNGRRVGEASGSGTGIPVYSDGTAWRTYYDNSVVQS